VPQSAAQRRHRLRDDLHRRGWRGPHRLAAAQHRGRRVDGAKHGRLDAASAGRSDRRGARRHGRDLAPHRGCRMSGLRKRQRGVAVLMAVLLVAVATILAVNVMWEATLNIRRTESALAADQALLYLQGGEAWAKDILARDLKDSQEYDHLGEEWATALEPLPIEGGTIAGRLEDLQ